MTPASDLVKLKKNPISSLNREQITFNKLKKIIESLQKKETNRIKELDYCLQFYYLYIRKEELKLLNGTIEMVKIANEFLKTKNCFSKKELTILAKLILDDIEVIFLMRALQDVPKEIEEIFKDLSKKDSTNLEEKEDDIDISDIKSTDSEEEIAAKLFESFFKKDESSFSSPKTKNQIEKDFYKKRIEEMGKKDINTIYKQLAKIFHPDLEPDIEKKSEKEKLMKQLTIAYETKDFYTLMALEMEWLHKNQDTSNIISLEKLKTYNKMLKNQIKDFNKKIHSLHFNPNYSSIRHFFGLQFTGINSLRILLKKIKQDNVELKKHISELCSPQGKMIIKSHIKEFIYDERINQNFNRNFY